MLACLVAVWGLAACAGTKPAGPAWPAPSTTAEDGGESLEPRANSVATAVEKSAGSKSADSTSNDDEPSAGDDAKPAAGKPDPESADAPADADESEDPIADEVILGDEIVIEIEDE